MHRFFVSPRAIEGDIVHLTDPDLLHQLTRVLRVRGGTHIVLLDGSGVECDVELTTIGRSEIIGRVIGRRANRAEPSIEITLFQAIPKSPTKFETILQHSTEIGITHFVPLVTERTEVTTLRNLDRLTRILRESSEQSERGIIPTLAAPMHFENAIETTGTRLIADSYVDHPLLRDIIPTIRNERAINLFVGPEGGFSEREIAAAVDAGVVNFSLGSRILRTETAGVAIASVILFS